MKQAWEILTTFLMLPSPFLLSCLTGSGPLSLVTLEGDLWLV